MSFNGAKLWAEARKYYSTWLSPPRASHASGAFTNRYVEAARASPYWAGHLGVLVDALIFVCLVFITVRIVL